jgi:hypothetical protein
MHHKQALIGRPLTFRIPSLCAPQLQDNVEACTGRISELQERLQMATAEAESFKHLVEERDEQNARQEFTIGKVSHSCPQ